MTTDEIIRMALEADCYKTETGALITDNVDLERFATLVAAHEREKFCGQDKPVECANGCPDNQVCDYCKIVEPVLSAVLAEREACAKVCDKYAEESSNPMNFAENCAAAIRARGE